MKVLCMPQAFKGSLGALEAARAMARGVRRVLPKATVRLLPMADGGDDTLDVLLASTGGRYFSAQVMGPTGRPVRARWGVLGDGETAVIEMAQASGLRLLRPHEMDPLRATTFGTGQLIKEALDAGYRRLIVGVGGSATVDGGAGAAQALGARFLDAQGHPLPFGGAALGRLHSIDLANLDPRLGACTVRVACDVDMPLCGPGGAWTFAAQKGASSAAMEQLAGALERFGQVVAEALGVDLRSMSLAGPAGGLSGGLHALLGAELLLGADLVLEVTGMASHMEKADLVLIGEGRLDGQSFRGKGTLVIAARAREANVPVVAVVGQVSEGLPELEAWGIAEVETLVDHARSVEEAQAQAKGLVAQATQQALSRFLHLRRGL